jgi:hypothetical protein
VLTLSAIKIKAFSYFLSRSVNSGGWTQFLNLVRQLFFKCITTALIFSLQWWLDSKPRPLDAEANVLSLCYHCRL